MSLFKDKNFLGLFVGGLFLSFGNRLYELALPLWLYEISGSSKIMGAMRAVEFLPNVLLGICVGLLVDRSLKKRTHLSSIAAQLILLAALLTCMVLKVKNVQWYYLLGFLLMTFGYLNDNVRIAITKLCIPKEQLGSANAKFASVQTGLAVAGPVITGIVVSLGSKPAAITVAIVSYAIGLGATLFVSAPETKASVERSTTVFADFLEGFRLLIQLRSLLALSFLVVFINAIGGTFDSLLLYHCKKVLNLSDFEVGSVMAASGLGAFISTFFVNQIRQKLQTKTLFAGGFLLGAVCYLLVAMVPSITLLIAAIFVLSFVGMAQAVAVWTYRQEIVPAQLIGRIAGLTGALFKVGMPIAIYTGGSQAAALGTFKVFQALAIVSLCLAVVSRVVLSKLEAGSAA